MNPRGRALVLSSILCGCGPGAAATQIVTLSIPATSTSAAPTVTATRPEPRARKPAARAVDPEHQKWIGTWVDPSTAYKTYVTVAVRGGRPTVVHSEESVGDKEIYEVRSSAWNDGTLEWSHYVPSTQYLVTYTCTDVVDDALVCSWTNDHSASGNENLPRVVPGAPRVVPGAPPPDDDQD